MWLLFALGSALFSGLTAVLAKRGIRTTDSTVATAVRTVVVLVFAWVVAAAAGSVGTVGQIAPATWAFLVLSGLATGASWLCYFRALSLGDVTRVAPVDKSSTALTVLLALVVLGEGLTWESGAACALILVGALVMAWPARGEKDPGAGCTPARGRGARSRAWLPWAVGSAVFASLTAILGKVGIEGVDSNLGTAVRTCVVLAMAWAMVAVEGKGPQVGAVPRDELAWIALSGVATGAAWLCYWRALQEGPASVVAPVDRLSIVVTAVLSRALLGERASRRDVVGLSLSVVGTVLMALPSL